MVFYRVKDWGRHYEVGESLRTKSITWLPLRNKHDGRGFRRIARLPNCDAVFCGFVLILELASKCPIRGVLADEDGPMTAEDMSIKTGFGADTFEAALSVLSDPDLGINWLIEDNWDDDNFASELKMWRDEISANIARRRGGPTRPTDDFEQKRADASAHAQTTSAHPTQPNPTLPEQTIPDRTQPNHPLGGGVMGSAASRAEAQKKADAMSFSRCWLAAERPDLLSRTKSLTELVLHVGDGREAIAAAEPELANGAIRDPFAYALARLTGAGSPAGGNGNGAPRKSPGELHGERIEKMLLELGKDKKPE